MRETVWRLHTGGTRIPSAKSDGLTATEDDVQLLVRNVVLLVWVGNVEEEVRIVFHRRNRSLRSVLALLPMWLARSEALLFDS